MEDDPVEEQRREHSRIGGVPLRELGDGGGDGGPGRVHPVRGQIADGPTDQLRHVLLERAVRHRHERREHRPHPLGVRLAGQHVAEGAQRGHVECVEQGDRALHWPETDQGVELGQGDEDLGLVVDVPVVAVRRVHGDPPGVLGRIPLAGLLRRRVGLQRQRLLRGEQLDQERQSPAELVHDPAAQFTLRVRCDPGVERPAVRAQRRTGVMRTEPVFGDGMRSRGGGPAHLGESRPGAPGVGLDHRAESHH